MKILTFLLIFPFVLSGAASKIKVVTSTSIFQDMIQNVGGEFTDVRSIVPRGSDPHRYEPKPSDVNLCRDADLIMINGLHLEVWIEKLIKNSNLKAKVFVITEGIKPIRSDQSTDPHAWMSAKNGMVYVRNIAAALIGFRPDLSEGLQQNLQVYLKNLQTLDAFIHSETQKIPMSQRILVSNHDAFQYFGKDYNLRLVPLMGISTEAEPKTSDILRIMEAVKNSGIQAIFVESSINPRTMEQLASDLSISLGGSLYSDSLGEADGPAGTYTGMLKTNVEMIVRALSQPDIHTSAARTQASPFLFVYYLIFILFLGGMTTVLVQKMIQ